MNNATATSYNYAIHIITKPPTAFALSAEWTNGLFIGTFGNSREFVFKLYTMAFLFTYIKPAPIMMPDLSQSPGGNGAGAPATNQTLFLLVLEFWGDGL
jgi:hypothetical protein